MRISYSALDTFQRCPAKYKFQGKDVKDVPDKEVDETVEEYILA